MGDLTDDEKRFVDAALDVAVEVDDQMVDAEDVGFVEISDPDRRWDASFAGVVSKESVEGGDDVERGEDGLRH